MPLRLVLLSLLLAAPALGRQAPARLVTMQGGLGLSVTELDDTRTIPTTGFGIQADVTPRLLEVVALRAEGGLTYLGPVCFDPDGGCARTDVVDRSRYTLLSGALAAGMFTPPVYLGTDRDGFFLALGAFAGREWIRAWKHAARCLNCASTELDLRGGLFVEPTAVLTLSPGLGLGASYRIYHHPADLSGRFTLRLTIGNAE